MREQQVCDLSQARGKRILLPLAKREQEAVLPSFCMNRGAAGGCMAGGQLEERGRARLAGGQARTNTFTGTCGFSSLYSDTSVLRYPGTSEGSRFNGLVHVPLPTPT